MNLVGVDVGGTFTDFVVVDDLVVHSLKVPTTRPQSRSIIETLEGLRDGEFGFVHGTTAATNMLLELSGARVALVTDAGFEDLVEIGRQRRVALYDLAADRAVALVEREGRIGHTDDASTIARLGELKPEAIAISLLGSFADDSVESHLFALLSDAFPEIPISVGSRVSPGFREYERTEATVLNAYLAPGIAGYLEELDTSVGAASSHVMTSSGGLVPFRSAAVRVGELTLSGPAGGVVASDALRRSHTLDSVITFDMGGTSTDVSRIGPDGIVVAGSQLIGGRVNRVPSIAIHTVGAGGGSIAWVDSGGALRVGPRSAGADPGPAAYGLGGAEPTVTDANLHLGHIGERGVGGLVMDRSMASEALGRLGRRIGLDADETATGVLKIVDAHMEQALRKVSVEEGFDPSRSSLVAYGGAGGLHASRLARRLRMRSVLVPPLAGVFSAVGLLMASPRVEVLETTLQPADAVGDAQLDSIRTRVNNEFWEVFGRYPTDMALFADARYESQSHELVIRCGDGALGEKFEVEHQNRFGFRLEGVPVEVVNVRAVASGLAHLQWADIGNPTNAVGGTPPQQSPTGMVSVDRLGLPPGFRTVGPLLVADSTATILVNEGETVHVLGDSTLEITW